MLLGNFSEISASNQVDTKFNIKVPVKFMINDNQYQVQQCQECNSAIPKYLNKRAKGDVVGGEEGNDDNTSSTVLKTIEEENMDNPVDQITFFCRQPIKRFDAADLDALSNELNVLYRKVTKDKVP